MMSAIYLEGWLPIILFCIGFAVLICVLARFIKQILLYFISGALFLIFVGILIYSVIEIGEWRGMAMGFYSISGLMGVVIGTGISSFIKKKRTKDTS